MSNTEFKSYVENPALLSRESLPRLEQLVLEMPYCQITQLMLALNYRKVDSIRYNRQLKVAAAYAGDRGLLRRHIEAVIAVEEEVVTNTLTSGPDIVVEEIEVDSIPEVTDSTTTEEAHFPEAETVLPELAESEPTSIENLIPLNTVEPIETDTAPLDEEAHLQELRQIIARRLAEIAEKAQRNEDETAAKLEAGDDPRFGSTPLSNPLLDAQNEVEGESLHESALPGLAELKAHEDAANAPDPEELLLAGYQAGAYSLEQSLKDAAETAENSTIENISPANSGDVPFIANNQLIEQFIRNKPRISAPHRDFYNPVDKAKFSNIDHEDIVSETLAIVHLKQGNTEKAVKIYEKLSLIYPEKSTYFAAQIAKIQESLSNN